MQMKSDQLLPDEISYLQPFVRWLGKFSLDDLNETVDSSLEKALRNRVRGVAIAEAQQRLDQDLRSLKDKTANSPGQDAQRGHEYGHHKPPKSEEIAEAGQHSQPLSPLSPPPVRHVIGGRTDVTEAGHLTSCMERDGFTVQ